MSVPTLNYRATEPPPVLAWWERVALILFLCAIPVVVAITWLACMGRAC